MGINRNKVLDAARKHQSRGQYDKAIAQYKKLVDADKRDVRSLLKIGDLYVRKGDRGSAIDTYQNVADHYAAQGFFLKAIAVYKQILKLDPSRLDAQVKLG
ncbi:MAG: tetratricopeptide repeat protein, partial [Myxococcales bacterium]